MKIILLIFLMTPMVWAEDNCKLVEIMSRPSITSARKDNYHFSVESHVTTKDKLVAEKESKKCELPLPFPLIHAYYSKEVERLVLSMEDTTYSVMATIDLIKCVYKPGPRLYGEILIKDGKLFEIYSCAGEKKDGCGKSHPVEISPKCNVKTASN